MGDLVKCEEHQVGALLLEGELGVEFWLVHQLVEFLVKDNVLHYHYQVSHYLLYTIDPLQVDIHLDTSVLCIIRFFELRPGEGLSMSQREVGQVHEYFSLSDVEIGSLLYETFAQDLSDYPIVLD